MKVNTMYLGPIIIAAVILIFVMAGTIDFYNNQPEMLEICKNAGYDEANQKFPFGKYYCSAEISVLDLLLRGEQ